MNASPDKHEDLYGILASQLKADSDHDGQVVAIVGGGGKTAALFALAVAARTRGLRVALTTTTHIRDPRLETGRDFDHFILLPGSGHGELQGIPAPGISIIAAGMLESEGRLQGIDAAQVAMLRRHYDLVLVEADGSRGLPVKAPAAHEPVLPASADLVVGVVGLDCLGKPMDEATVHRPGLFGPLCGCAPGEAICTSHIVALCQAKDGLFKCCPPQAVKVLLLNKADILFPMDGRAVAGREAASRTAVANDDEGRDAGNRLAGISRELEALRGSLDGYLFCSLEPGFRMFHQWFRAGAASAVYS